MARIEAKIHKELRYNGYIAKPSVVGAGKPAEYRIYRSGGDRTVLASVPGTDEIERVFRSLVNAWVANERASLNSTSGNPNVPVVANPAQTVFSAGEDGFAQFFSGENLAFDVYRYVRSVGVENVRSGGALSTVVSQAIHKQWPGFVREVFGRLYADVEPLESPVEGNEWVDALHDKLSDSPQWKKLRSICLGDAWMAAAVTATSVKKLEGLAFELLQKLPANLAEMASSKAILEECLGTAHLSVVEIGSAIADARAVADKISELAPIALEDVAASAEEIVSALSVLGYGTFSCAESCASTPRREAIELLLANPSVQEIVELAGRMRIAVREAQKAKTKYASEYIGDVEMGGEIARALPSEQVLLADEQTELVAIKRLVERELLQYELHGRQPMDRGPLILCIDESGSMSGAPHQFAMALALAMLELCAIQRRFFALIRFDSSVCGQWIVDKPALFSFADFVKHVCKFSGGGTNFSAPLKRASELVATRGALRDADVLLLTDGGSSGWYESAEFLRSQKVRLWGIELGGCFSAEDKKHLDHAVRIERLNERDVSLVFDL